MRTNTELSEREESFRELGLLNIGRVYWDNSTPALYEEAIRRYEGMVSHLGPLVVRTGQYTGRSANLRVNRKFGRDSTIEAFSGGTSGESIWAE